MCLISFMLLAHNPRYQLADYHTHVEAVMAVKSVMVFICSTLRILRDGDTAPQDPISEVNSKKLQEVTRRHADEANKSLKLEYAVLFLPANEVMGI